jgi:hypothetical protein
LALINFQQGLTITAGHCCYCGMAANFLCDASSGSSALTLYVYCCRGVPGSAPCCSLIDCAPSLSSPGLFRCAVSLGSSTLTLNVYSSWGTGVSSLLQCSLLNTPHLTPVLLYPGLGLQVGRASGPSGDQVGGSDDPAAAKCN